MSAKSTSTKNAPMRGKATVKKRSAITLPVTAGWGGSAEMLKAGHGIHEGLLSRALEPEVGRALVSNMRNCVNIVQTMLDHAKFTKRLVAKSKRLEGFTL